MLQTLVDRTAYTTKGTTKSHRGTGQGCMGDDPRHQAHILSDMGRCVIMDFFDAAVTGARSAFLIEINKLSKNTFSVKLSSDITTFRDWNLKD